MEPRCWSGEPIAARRVRPAGNANRAHVGPRRLRAHLLRAAALLLEVVTDNAPIDPDARALGLERALRLVAIGLLAVSSIRP